MNIDTYEWTCLKQKHFLLLKTGRDSQHTPLWDQQGINASVKRLKPWQSFKGLYGKEETVQQWPLFSTHNTVTIPPLVQKGKCCIFVGYVNYKMESYFVSKHMKIYKECVYVYLPNMIQRNVLSNSVKNKLEKRIKRLLTMLSFKKCKSKQLGLV